MMNVRAKRERQLATSSNFWEILFEIHSNNRNTQMYVRMLYLRGRLKFHRSLLIGNGDLGIDISVTRLAAGARCGFKCGPRGKCRRRCAQQ